MADFAAKYETLYAVEEGEPYLEDALKKLGFHNVIGKEKLTIQGEFNTKVVRDALTDAGEVFTYKVENANVPARPPVLCAGCPHRGFYFALKNYKDKYVSAGDIGCYALAVNPPLNGFDFQFDMGAGFSTLVGFSRALKAQGDTRKVIGQLGDSTFFHSGLTSLIDLVSSETNAVAVVLDNSITAMTGHQENPGTYKNLMGYESPAISIEALVRACGVDDDHLRIVDPIDQKAVCAALDAGLEADGLFVIITKRPCALLKEVAKANAGKHVKVNADKCVGCKMCMKIACPSIAFDDVNKKALIADEANCNQCGLCMQQCKVGAIEKVGE